MITNRIVIGEIIVVDLMNIRESIIDLIQN